MRPNQLRRVRFERAPSHLLHLRPEVEAERADDAATRTFPRIPRDSMRWKRETKLAMQLARLTLSSSTPPTTSSVATFNSFARLIPRHRVHLCAGDGAGSSLTGLGISPSRGAVRLAPSTLRQAFRIHPRHGRTMGTRGRRASDVKEWGRSISTSGLSRWRRPLKREPGRQTGKPAKFCALAIRARIFLIHRGACPIQAGGEAAG
jgi:hypothetical protein